MSPRAVIAFVVAAIVAFGGGMAVWVLVRPKAETSTAAPASDAERSVHRERFLGGDPDRNVRGGQEMKPRW